MQYKRATPYNSSISQAFMVMSFAAAGLLLSVQVLGDRPSDSSRQASSLDSPPAAEFESSPIGQPVGPSPASQTAISNPTNSNSTASHSPTSHPVEPNLVENPPIEASIRTPRSSQGAHRWDKRNQEQPTGSVQSIDASAIQGVVRRPAEQPWSWLTHPLLFPIRIFHAC